MHSEVLDILLLQPFLRLFRGVSGLKRAPGAGLFQLRALFLLSNSP